MNGTNKDWADRGHLKDVMDQLRAAGEVCDMIVISPNAGGNIGEGVWNGYFDMEGWAYERFFFEEFLQGSPLNRSTHRFFGKFIAF